MEASGRGGQGREGKLKFYPFLAYSSFLKLPRCQKATVQDPHTVSHWASIPAMFKRSFLEAYRKSPEPLHRSFAKAPEAAGEWETPTQSHPERSQPRF
jgi:hypothetical protein